MTEVVCHERCEHLRRITIGNSKTSVWMCSLKAIELGYGKEEGTFMCMQYKPDIQKNRFD